MKNLVFEELLLLSRAEKAARRVKFHPRCTVLKGINNTGKSSILKALYATLGAEPAKTHPKWKDANVISSLRFSVDGVRYRMIRSGSRFSLFDATGSLAGTLTSVTTQLAPAIASMFSFRLLLRSAKEKKEIQATPAFLFLPFYVDQDVGWLDTLGSFDRLRQFESPKADVYAFHFGIKPSEYYAAKARLSQALADAEQPRQERNATQKILNELEQQLQTADFNLNIEAFREEVDQLLERCRELKTEEQELRERMNDAYTSLRFVTDQIDITKSTLKELQDDREHAAFLPGSDVECPVCHAHYENGFAERFAIAVDEDGCVDLLNDLDQEQRQLRTKYEGSREATQRARVLVAEVESLLSVRREQLVLRDVVRSEGRREMRGVIAERLRNLDAQLAEFAEAESNARAEMKKFTKRERTKAILTEFRSEFARLLQRLAVVSIPASSLERPESRIRETGSTLSRAILAHYFASIKTIVAHSTSALCPLVIDSPKQQDQDEDSWLRIRTVINEERPKGTQLILALGDDGGTDFGGEVIELADQYAVLIKDEFEAASAELMPLVEISLRPGPLS